MSTLAQNIIRDVIASRPAAGIEGRLFFASDTGANYYDDGAAWQSVGGSLTVTTKGDLQGFSTVPARVPVGTNGYVMTADSGAAVGVSWQPGGGGGGSIRGTAKFAVVAGSISGLVLTGIISGVTRTGTGQYTVTITGSPTDYVVLLSCADTISIATLQVDPAASYTSTGFIVQGILGSAAGDPDFVWIAII